VAAAGIKVTGDAAKALAKLNQGLSTPSLMAALIHVHGHFVEKTEKMFDKEVDPYGNPWTPLTEATREIRVNLGFPPGPINTRSGRLRDYLVSARPDILGHSDGVISYAFPSRGWPDNDLIIRMKQADGQGRGPARPVVGMNAGDVGFVLSTLGASVYLGRMF